MKNRNLISSLLVLLTPIFLYGQSVLGVVTDTEGNPLAGANVVVEDTDKGGVTDNTGKYTIDVGASGDYDLTASYIGYSSVTNTVTVNDIVGTVNFLLEVDAVTLSALEVLASRADETTPVAYTTVTKEEMEIRLGSQDIPMSEYDTIGICDWSRWWCGRCSYQCSWIQSKKRSRHDKWCSPK